MCVCEVWSVSVCVGGCKNRLMAVQALFNTDGSPVI